MNFIDRWLQLRAQEREFERAHEIELIRLENERIQESSICQSCEALKLEIARLHDQNNKLVEGILHKPEAETVQQQPLSELGPKKGQKIPWAVRRQMLETEDRAQARIIAERKKQAEAEAKFDPAITQSITSLEEELGVVNGD
jgi:hypothetical protein